MKNKNLILFFSLVIFACQPIEKFDQVVFDNNQFSKFDLFVNSIEITQVFENKISEPYIGHTMKISPSDRIIKWIEENFKAVGNENKFSVKILDASITQSQIENTEAKNFDEKMNYRYDLFYLVEFNLYDNFNNLIASTLVESVRSTTSGMYISIQEKENIVNDLIYQSVNDVSTESKNLIKIYMGEFLL